MTFADRCVHCDHYHAQTDKCCYCEKEPYALEKTREQHLAEIGDLDDDPIE